MRNIIFQTLIDRGYSEKSAILVLDDLLNLASPLDGFLKEWISKGTEKDFKDHGYSIVSFLRERRMTYPAALLTMDWLIKDPENAIKSLTRGIK